MSYCGIDIGTSTLSISQIIQSADNPCVFRIKSHAFNINKRILRSDWVPPDNLISIMPTFKPNKLPQYKRINLIRCICEMFIKNGSIIPFCKIMIERQIGRNRLMCNIMNNVIIILETLGYDNIVLLPSPTDISRRLIDACKYLSDTERAANILKHWPTDNIYSKILEMAKSKTNTQRKNNSLKCVLSWLNRKTLPPVSRQIPISNNMACSRTDRADSLFYVLVAHKLYELIYTQWGEFAFNEMELLHTSQPILSLMLPTLVEVEHDGIKRVIVDIDI